MLIMQLQTLKTQSNLARLMYALLIHSTPVAHIIATYSS
jgi:hypothetical protein